MNTLPTLFHLYNRQFFGGQPAPPLAVAGCRTVHEKQDLLNANGVVVHLPSLLATHPAQELFKLRKLVSPRQIWIAESMESAENYPQLEDPDFMAMFDIEMTYRQSSDIWIPNIPGNLANRYRDVEVTARKKTCCAFVSSKFDTSDRRSYMKALMQELEVHSYGKYLRNRRVFFDRGEKTKLRVMRKYSYTLAFENSISPDYVTEKFYQPLMTGTVPIYLGAPNIDEFAPGKNCFVNVRDFNDPAELAGFVRQADPASFQTWRTRELNARYLRKLERIQKPWQQVLGGLLAARLSANKPVLNAGKPHHGAKQPSRPRDDAVSQS